MPVSYSAALTSIEMSLKYQGAAWVRGPEDESGIVVCGVYAGKPFAMAVHGVLNSPSRSILDVLTRWRKAGASTGLAGSIKDALMIVDGASSRAR